MIKNRYHKINVSRKILPILISDDILSHAIEVGKLHHSPILSVVVGTKPDFYKQAPLVVEAAKENMPILVIDTGQHFDDTLGFGIKEFELQRFVGCNLQIRGDLMEKASELITKFGYFGRYCKKRYGIDSQLLPLVHGDTIVAGIAPLAWVFGMGQKVAQNEAGLRSMSPEAMKKIRIHEEPTRNTVEKFINEQFEGKWFLTLEEPFPEQIDTWICSAGTKYFFAPTEMNKSNLVREGYPEDFIHVVGNSVVDAIHITRKQKVRKSIFDIYPNLESGQWIRVDIHRRENLTHHRFTSIVRSLVDLVKRTQFKVNLIMLNATEAALVSYGLDNKIKSLAEEYSHRFLITPVWKQYGHVIEFLDSGHCWAEMTDSGSMQEELLYFPDVLSLTLRLNTDRPETILNARSNILVPPVSSEWILSMIDKAFNRNENLGIHLRNKKRIFGEPGKVSKQIIRVLKKEFEEGVTNFYPWLHQRINLWKEDQTIDYL